MAALARAWAADVDAAAAAAWRPRYNVAPGDRHVLLRAAGGVRRIEPATFGLPGRRGRLHVNARIETAAALPAFGGAWRARRCAVPADGFFEWEGGAGARRPTWFHRAGGRPLLLAALYGEAPGGLGFVVLTAPANAEVRRLHGRMPVLVPEDRLEAWLAGEQAGLDPVPDGFLAARPVSPRVNSVENDDPACVAPAAPDPQLPLL